MTSVAASSAYVDDEGVRQPAGDVHAWRPGQNQTVCGVPLSRARLDRFPHVPWADAVWVGQTGAGPVLALCRRCSAAMSPRRGRRRGVR
jgi:hypothetical protein